MSVKKKVDLCHYKMSTYNKEEPIFGIVKILHHCYKKYILSYFKCSFTTCHKFNSSLLLAISVTKCAKFCQQLQAQPQLGSYSNFT